MQDPSEWAMNRAKSIVSGPFLLVIKSVPLTELLVRNIALALDEVRGGIERTEILGTPAEILGAGEEE